MRHSFRLFAALMVLVLFATACGGGGDSTATDDTATEEASASDTSADDSDATQVADEPEDDESVLPTLIEPDEADESVDEPEDDAMSDDDAGTTGEVDCSVNTASARGVTADTISIGVSLLDFELLKSLNLSPFGWGDQQLVWQTVIDDVNARGGINCRMIEATYAFYSPLGTADAEAKCLELTADVETFVVMFGFVGPAEPANTCIVGQQETALFGGRITPERLAQANAPWVHLNRAPERKIDVLVNLLADAGELDGRSFGVLSSPATAELHPLALDALGAAGANVAFDLVTESPVGDTAAEDSEWSTLTEVVRGGGVDTLFINGGTNAAIRNLDLAGIDVTIITSDNDGLNNLGASVAPEQADGVITSTGVTDEERWDEPAIVACREMIAAANPDIASELRGPTERVDDQEGWFSSVLSACSRIDFLEKVLTATGPELNYDNLSSTLADMGTFTLPGFPFNSLSATKFDADDAARLGVFDSTIGDSGEIAPLGDVVDAG